MSNITTKISRNSPCVCGSGRRFKVCCGAKDAPIWNSQAMGRIKGSLRDPKFASLLANSPRCSEGPEDLPPGILVKQLNGVLPWREMTGEVIRTASAAQAAIVNQDGSVSVDQQRVTGIVELGWAQAAVDELTRRAYLEIVEPFYNRQIRWFERPQVLRYVPGSFYRPHADADYYNINQHNWRKVLDRDLSVLIYLDDDYRGGELVFPNFDFCLQPKAGMLVAFPSDNRYLHGAMPVLSGQRHSLVSWSSALDTPMILQHPPEDAIPVKRA